jgi:hypothetical protein
MSYEDRQPWFDEFPFHSAVCFGDKLTYAGYKDVPVSYLFCEDDKCIPPAAQQAGIDVVEEVSGNKVHVVRANLDHIPNISAPQLFASFIVGLVNKAASA